MSHFDKKTATNRLYKKDMPVIIMAFVLAFALPHSVSPETINEHVSGIALGFGLAWLIKFMADWKRIAKTDGTRKGEESNEA